MKPRFWQGPKFYGCRITLEQLEDRIVLDAAGGVSQQPDDQQPDAAQQVGADIQQAAAQANGEAPPPVGSQTPPGQAASQPSQETESLTTIIPHQDLNVILVSNDIRDIKGITCAAAEGAKVIVYDAQEDNLESLSAVLDQLVQTTGRKIDNLAVVGHAEAGMLTIGSDEISFFTVSEHAAMLKTIGEVLSLDAQIQFFGCSLAGDVFGQALVDKIAAFTAADIFASTDTTGGTWHDWTLEYSSDSSVAMDTVLDAAVMASSDTEALPTGPGYPSGWWLPLDVNPSGDAIDLLNPPYTTNVNGTIFFVATDGGNGSHHRELWKTDGTEAGTVMVEDINLVGDGFSGTLGSNPHGLVGYNGDLYFVADDGVNGNELWRSDGTQAGTYMVSNLNPTAGAGSNPAELTVMGGYLYFSADDGSGSYGTELYRTDGTTVELVKDLNPGATSGGPHGLTAVGSWLYFAAGDASLGIELWRTDGNPANTVMIGTATTPDINPAGHAFDSTWVPQLEYVDSTDTLFFSAYDSVHGNELWKIQNAGTIGGLAELVLDVDAAATNGIPVVLQGSGDGKVMESMGGALYFAGQDAANGLELWKSDGTAGGTSILMDINPSGDSGPDHFVSTGTRVFFSADDGSLGLEPWVTDGTVPGTFMVADTQLGAVGGFYRGFGVVGSVVTFSADDGTAGVEPWRSDGTSAGTFMRADLYSGPLGSYPAGGAWDAATGTLYVAATSVDGRELLAWSNAAPENVLVQPPSVPYEDGPVDLTNALRVSDDAHDTLTVTVTAGQGFSTISMTNAGSCPSFTIIDPTHIEMSGNSDQINLTLGTLAGTLAANWSGPGEAQIFISTSDQNGLNDADTLFVPVKPVNDAPLVTAPASAITAGPGDPKVFSGADLISVSDVDAGTGTVIIRLVAIGGTITLSGTTNLNFMLGGGTADIEMIFTGAIVDMNAALNGLVYTPLDSAPALGSLLITMTDAGKSGVGGVMSAGRNVDIYINGGTGTVNQAPTIMGPPDQVVAANTDLTFGWINLNQIMISDPDSPDGSAQVSVSLVASSGSGSFTLASTANLSFPEGDGINDNKLSFRGSINDVNTALNGLMFFPSTDFVGITTVQIAVNDLGHTGTGGMLGSSDSISVTVTGTQNQPPLNTVLLPLEITDVDTPLVLTSISVSDPDAGSSEIRVGLIAQHGTISLNGTAGLSFISGDGTDDALVRFTGSISSINTALNGMTFTPDAGYTGWADIFIGTNDQGNTGLGGAKSDLDKVDILVGTPAFIPENQGPTFHAPQFVYAYDDTPLTFTGANQLSISDPDTGASQLVVVGIGSNHGTFTLFTTTGLTFLTGDGTDDTQMGILGTIADINNALAGLQFMPEPDYSGRAGIGLSVNDAGNSGTGGPYQANVSMDVWVYAVNDPPVITVPGAQVVNEDTQLLISGISVADIDADEQTLEVTLEVSHGTLTLVGAGLTFSTGDGMADSSMTFTGNLTNINNALTFLYYQGALDYNGLDTLNVSVNDQYHIGLGVSAGTDTETVNITVNAVNDAPIVTSNPAPVGIVEDNPPTTGTVDLTNVFRVQDVDGDILNVTVSASYGGAPSGSILMDPGGGAAVLTPNDPVVPTQWSIQGLPNDVNLALATLHEHLPANINGNLVYSISASDGIAPPVMGSTVLTVTPVNDAPLLDNSGQPRFTPVLVDDFTSGGNNTEFILGTTITDVDASAQRGIAVTGVDDTHGTWEYSTDGGGSWTAFGGVSDSAAVLLNYGNLEVIRFVPDAGYSGTATITYRAWDHTDGLLNGATGVDASVTGGATAFSTAFSTASETAMVVVNRAPVLDSSGNPLMTSVLVNAADPAGNTVASIIGAAITDLDAGALEGIAVASVQEGPGIGYWEYSIDGGVSWTSFSGVWFGNAVVLTDDASNLIRFVPDTDYSGNPSFTYYAWDRTDGLSNGQFGAHILGDGYYAYSVNAEEVRVWVNRAPVLDNSGEPRFTPVLVDDFTSGGNTTESIVGTTITDVDMGAQWGIAVIGVDDTHGTWEYAWSGGGGWTAFGGVSDSAAVLLNYGNLEVIRFVPDPGYSGTATITYRAWDHTDGLLNGATGVDASVTGGATAFSTASETAMVVVNTAPALDSSGNPLMTSVLVNAADPAGNTVASIIGAAITDSDAGALEGIAVASVQEGPGIGYWEYSIDGGVSWTSFSGVWFGNAVVLTDDASNLIRFVPDTDYSGNPSFTYYAWDRTDGLINGQFGAHILGDGYYAYSVNAEEVHVWVNRAPVLDNSGAPVFTPIMENDFSSPGNTTEFLVGTTIADADAGAQWGIAVIGVDDTHGTWEYTWSGAGGWVAFGGVSDSAAVLLNYGNLEVIRFVPDAGYGGTATITYRAWDHTDGLLNGATGVDASVNGGASAYSDVLETATITVISANNAPVLDNSGDMTLTAVNEEAVGGAGNTVAAIIASAGGDRITDADGGALEGIAVTSVDNAHGTWEYSVDGGLMWQAFGMPNDTSARLLGADALVRLIPSLDYSGTIAPGITFRAWDQTDGHVSGDVADVTVSGGATAYSAEVETASIVVNPVNDPPTASNMNQFHVISEDDPLLDLSDIGVADMDDAMGAGTETITARLTLSNVLAGHLSANGGATYNAGTGVWERVGTIAEVNAALAGVTFTPSADWNGMCSIATHVQDASGALPAGGDGAIDIQVNAMNDAPTITDPGAQSTNEDIPLVFDAGHGNLITVGDVDAGSGVIEVVVDVRTGHGIATLGSTVGITIVNGFDSSYYIAFQGQLTDLNNALNGLVYTPDADYTGSAGGFSIQVDDKGFTGLGGYQVSTLNVAVTVGAAADAPTATNLTQSHTVPEDSGPLNLTDIVVTDPDAGDTITARLTLNDLTAGVLSATDGATYTPATGIWTITGTVAQVNAALAGLTFTPTGDWNGATTITTHVEDAAATGPADGTFDITVSGVNDPPTATNMDQSLMMAEDAGAQHLVMPLVVSDADAGDTITATLTLNDVASGTLSSNDGATYTPATGIWTISGTVAQVNAALAGVTFTPTPDWNGATSITTHIEDAAHSGPADGSVAVMVFAAADAPTATNLTQSHTVPEDSGPLNLTDIVLNDPDAGDTVTATLTLNDLTAGVLSATDGATFVPATGIWTITGTVAQVNSALAGVTFTPTSDWNGATSITTHVEDAAATGPANGTIDITVSGINDPPTATNMDQSLMMAEDAGAQHLVMPLVVSDADAGDTITVTLTLEDRSAGILDSSAGTYDPVTGVWIYSGTVAQVNAALADLTFTPTPDWNGATSITTHIEDAAHSGPADGSVAVMVFAPADAPTVTNLTQSHTIPEDSGPLNLTDIVVSDPDAGDTITARLTLNDVASGTLSANDGATYTPATGIWTITGTVAQVNTALAGLTFTPTADWNGATSITTHVQDAAATGPADGTVDITVSGVNDPPTATNMDQSLMMAEDAGAQHLVMPLVVSDADAGDTITATLTLNDVASGTLSANDGATYTPGTGIWTKSGTIEEVNAALAGVTFTPTADWNGATTIAVHIEDAAHAGPADGSIAVMVFAAADAPTATNLTQSHTVPEDSGPLNLTDIVVSDPDAGDTITARLTLNDVASGTLSANDGATYTPATGIWTITGTVAQVNAALAGVTFTPTADWNGATTITTHVEDAAATGPADGTVDITVSGVNDPPTATNMTQTQVVMENGSVLLDAISVTDSDQLIPGGEMITATLTVDNPANGFLTAAHGATYESGIWSITGDVLTVNQALADVTFAPTTGWNGTVIITTRIADAAGTGPADGVITVNVVETNDTPTATNMNQAHALAEDSGALNLTDIVVSDPDAGDTITARLTLNDLTAGVLSATDGATFVPATGIWTITGTLAQVNAALANVTFTPAGDWNGTTTIAAHVEDSLGTGPTDGTISITVSPVNDVPTATNMAQSLMMPEDSGPWHLVMPIVVSDADAGDTITATLTLEDRSAGILDSSAGTYDPVTGVWTYSGTVPQVNAALADLTFTSASDWNGATSITTHVQDAAATGPADGSVAVMVFAAADAPTTTNLTQSHTVPEDSGPLNLTDIVVSDPDAGDTITARLTLNDIASGTLSSNDGALYTPGTGIWTITGTVAQVNTALAGVTFTPAAGWSGVATITTHVEDAAATGPANGTIDITVSGVNDPPTATNMDQSLMMAEDAGAQHLVMPLVVSDADAGDTITATLTLSDVTAGLLSSTDGATYTPGTGTWSISGTVAQVNAALAGVTFTPTPDWNGATTIAVHIEDAAHAGPADGTIDITVSGVNDIPTATNLTQVFPAEFEDVSVPLGQIVVSDLDGVTEQITATMQLSSPGAGTLTAGGGSYDPVTGTWTMTGTVAGVNASLSGLTFVPALNWNGALSIVTHIEDAAGTGPADGNIGVNVAAVNDAPTVASLDTIETEIDPSDRVQIVLSASPGPANEVGQTLTFFLDDVSNLHGTLYDSEFGSGVLSGAVTLAAPGSGSLTAWYMPEAGYNGPASFTYHVTDSGLTGGPDLNSSAGENVSLQVGQIDYTPPAPSPPPPPPPPPPASPPPPPPDPGPTSSASTVTPVVDIQAPLASTTPTNTGTETTGSTETPALTEQSTGEAPAESTETKTESGETTTGTGETATQTPQEVAGATGTGENAPSGTSPEGSTQQQVSLEAHTTQQQGPGEATGPVQPVQGVVAGAVGGAHGGQIPGGAGAGPGTVVVFNMAQISTAQLFTSGQVDIGSSPVVAAGSLGTYLADSLPPPPANADERAAQASQQAEAVMWNTVSKSIPSCTRCAELAQQAVQVFW